MGGAGPALVRDLGTDETFDYKAGPVRGSLRSAAADGNDVYFDNVAGNHLDAALVAVKRIPGSPRKIAMENAASRMSEARAVYKSRDIVRFRFISSRPSSTFQCRYGGRASPKERHQTSWASRNMRTAIAACTVIDAVRGQL